MSPKGPGHRAALPLAFRLSLRSWTLGVLGSCACRMLWAVEPYHLGAVCVLPAQVRGDRGPEPVRLARPPIKARRACRNPADPVGEGAVRADGVHDEDVSAP